MALVNSSPGNPRRWPTRHYGKNRQAQRRNTRHLRRLLYFIESTPEERGVCMMRDELQREIQAATVSAYRALRPRRCWQKQRDQIQEYLSNACVPLKRNNWRRLEFDTEISDIKTMTDQVA